MGAEIMPNITIHLDDDTHRLAKIYAAKSGTSLSKMFRDHIRNVSKPVVDNSKRSILEQYSVLKITGEDAMSALGFSCLEELYAATIDAGLQLPHISRKDALQLTKQVRG